MKINKFNFKKALLNEKILWAFSFFLNFNIFLFLYFVIKPNYKPLALHYNVLIGVEWYGQGRNLYLIPFAGLVIIILNIIINKSLKVHSDFFSPLTVFVSICVQIILFSSILFLTQVN